MATITAQKEVLPRLNVDEYGRVHVQLLVRVTDDEGEVNERLWRRVITPDDDLDTMELRGDPIPASLRASCEAARYPAAVARWEELKASTPALPG